MMRLEPAHKQSIRKWNSFGTRSSVRLPRANHYVFLSNEADVLREMNAFLASLP
jgi:hypothetical protein